MKAVDRAQHWISVDPVLDGTYMEIRIHGDTPREDAPALLSANEARALARSLLLIAEQLEPVNYVRASATGKVNMNRVP
jgi:hypothetical protein